MAETWKKIYMEGGTDVAIADGGTGASTAQAAIDALTAVSGAAAEHVLTKDFVSGNAIFKDSLKHTQGTDRTLGDMVANVNMNTYKLTSLSAPSTAGDSIRATATITEAALESVIAAAATKTTAAWNPTIGSGGDYATWALMIAGMPDLIAHAVTVTIEAGTTLTETCDLKNKHGILADGAITIQAEKYFPESSTVPTADSATATTLRDAALTTAAKGDDYFNGCWIYIIDGTGTDNGYVLITDYDDSDGDVFVASWPGTQPDNTSRYLILGALIDCAGTQELGLDIADCTCPLTFNGIGVDDSNNRGVEISRCFSVDMYWCGIYGSDRTGLFVQDSFLIDVRYSGIVNNNTDNNSVHSGIFFRAVARGTAITNGISDNNQRGVYLDAGSFGQMQANFGDGNGTWGTYAIQGAQAYMVGTECSGSSGNHSDAGTAGANSDDQAAAFT